MRNTCILWALIIAAFPAQAVAADEVQIDPDSPSGAEYKIPFVGERESARAKQSRRNAKRDRGRNEGSAQAATEGDSATSGGRERERKRDLGRLFGEGIGPNASARDSLAGRSPDLRPGDRGESAPLWTVVVWVAALLMALLVVAAGALFVLPEGARERVLGRFGGLDRVLARSPFRRKRP